VEEVNELKREGLSKDARRWYSLTLAGLRLPVNRQTSFHEVLIMQEEQVREALDKHGQASSAVFHPAGDGRAGTVWGNHTKFRKSS
jgi:hypothetical protein